MVKLLRQAALLSEVASAGDAIGSFSGNAGSWRNGGTLVRYYAIGGRRWQCRNC